MEQDDEEDSDEATDKLINDIELKLNRPPNGGVNI